MLADSNTGIKGSTLGEALGFSLLCRLKDSREQGRGPGTGEPELILPFGRRAWGWLSAQGNGGANGGHAGFVVVTLHSRATSTRPASPCRIPPCTWPAHSSSQPLPTLSLWQEEMGAVHLDFVWSGKTYEYPFSAPASASSHLSANSRGPASLGWGLPMSQAGVGQARAFLEE